VDTLALVVLSVHSISSVFVAVELRRKEAATDVTDSPVGIAQGAILGVGPLLVVLLEVSPVLRRYNGTVDFQVGGLRSIDAFPQS